MNYDKIFYTTWGLVFILAGICAILGMYLQLSFLAIVMLWLISSGILLLIVGGVTIKSSGKTSTMQMIAGLSFVVVSAGLLSVVLELLNVYIALAIIIVAIGICVVVLGLSKSR